MIEISQDKHSTSPKVYGLVFTLKHHMQLAHPNFDKTLIYSTWNTHASKDQKDFYWLVMYGLGRGGYEKDIQAKLREKRGNGE